MNSTRTDHTEEDAKGAELVTSDGRSLPLVSAGLEAVAIGGIARVVLEQTFENPHAETLHVTYRMPLPADGAVSGYEFVVGARTIKGRVEPKEIAREQFEQAIASGRTAALLEQNRADIFTQEIGNIPAGETILARITVDQRLAWLPEGQWELRFPTVIGPRYIGSHDTAEDARAVHVSVADAGVIRARLSLEVDVGDELAPGRKVESPSHRLAPATDGRRDVYELSALDGAKLDRDIVVRWAVAQPEIGASLHAGRPAAGAHAHVAYGLVTIVPPALDARFATVSRDLIVLIDTSGSMGGGPLDQAKRVVSLLVDSLGEQDRIELIEFSSTPRAWQKGPLSATAANKKNAIAWVRSLEAGGATEMYSAIVEGMKALRPGAQRQVVLVTDGYIGGENRIVELLHERLPADCRLHVVGVGSAVNRTLATSLARAGRGAEVLVGLDEDAERGSRRLLARTESPVLTNVSVSGDALIELAPEHVPDVFAGAPLVCAAKLKAEGGALVVRGELAGGAVWERTLRVSAMREGEGNPALGALFAREHVADLEMRWTIGREAEMIDRTIERVGVVFQIATRMTSWVAIDDVRSVDPTSGSRRIAQPQELPYGTSMQSFGLGGPGGPIAGPVMSTRAGTVKSGMIDQLLARPASRIGVALPPPERMGRASPPSPPRAMPRPAMAPGAPPLESEKESSEEVRTLVTSVPSRSAPSFGARAPEPEGMGAPLGPPADEPPPAGMVSPQQSFERLPVSPPPKRQPNMLAMILALLFILLVIAALVWFFLR